ncbi:hypothetical protein EV216_11740 [Rhodovulum steppense]|uniref:Uncharacterized protein n=1 Tax=Rhodovulum steppense TaxID=540251 RepID=A0A4R1YSA3_9RHOB|nr:hypothetical protein EV216_11740 [Rhodovulum steppense]
MTHVPAGARGTGVRDLPARRGGTAARAVPPGAA